MDYDSVATAVFTPLEYGAVGLSEEAAAEKCGGSAGGCGANPNIEVFHQSFAPLEWSLAHDREVDAFPAFAKIICDKRDPSLPVLGMHYLGPNAGEVIQGYAVSIKKVSGRAYMAPFLPANRHADIGAVQGAGSQ